MKYALMIYGENAHAATSESERDAFAHEYLALNATPGMFGGAQLHPVSSTTTVQVDRGKKVLTDGPFIEAKEYLGGFYLFEAADLDAALEVAEKIPAARIGGAVEVRPIVEG
jgi:hypothetical protein